MSLNILIPKWQIEQRAAELAQLIRKCYGCDLPLFVILMEGAKPFADLLLSHLEQADTVLITAKSYKGTQQSQTVDIQTPEQYDRAKIFGREILILDDIFDTGRTLAAVSRQLYQWGASDIRAMTLLKRKTMPVVDSLWKIVMLGFGFEVKSDAFVVGFGLDYNDKFRELPDVCILENPS